MSYILSLELNFILFLIFGPFRQQPALVKISHLFPSSKMLETDETYFFLIPNYVLLFVKAGFTQALRYLFFRADTRPEKVNVTRVSYVSTENSSN